MNLTEEQWNLLRTIVGVYNWGDKSEFVFLDTLSSGASLCYSGGHPVVAIAADETDFEQLEHEDLIRIRRDGQALRGKPTQLGINTVGAAERNDPDGRRESGFAESLSGKPAQSLERTAQPVSRQTPSQRLTE